MILAKLGMEKVDMDLITKMVINHIRKTLYVMIW